MGTKEQRPDVRGPARAGPPPAALTWRVWPLAEDWKRGLLAFASLIFFPVLFYVTGGCSTGMAVFAFVVLFFSIAGFLLPAEYSLDENEIRIRHLGIRTVRKKSEFKRVVVYPEAVLFSPFEKPSFLDYYRGVFLKIPRAGRGPDPEALKALARIPVANARGNPPANVSPPKAAK